MSEKIHAYQPHPYRPILRGYGITMDMATAYLKMSYPYVVNMLSGRLKMSLKAEVRLQKLVDRLQNPVFEDEVVPADMAT